MTTPGLRFSLPCRSFLRSLATISAMGIALAGCERLTASTETYVDALPALVAEPGIRIGDFDDPNVGFSRVGSVDVDRDGNIYVLEASVPEIRVFSPAGVLLRRIGRRGGGPGEFERAPRFGVVGDTVWALDSGNNRITLFDRQGAVLSTGTSNGIQVPLPSSLGYVFPAMMRSDGKFTSHFSRVAFSRDMEPTGVEPTDSIPVPLVLFDATGAVTDTVGWAPRPPPRMWRPPAEDDSEMQRIRIGGRPMYVPDPPTTLPWWQPLMDGYLVVETPLAETQEDGVFTVTRIGVAGDTAYSRAIRYRPDPYSESDLDSIAVKAARGEAGGMVPYAPAGSGPPVPDDWQAIANTLRARMSFPENRLPLQYPWVAQDESVWLRLAQSDGPTAHWILLDPLGRPRGQLELPSDIRILWNRGDTFWAADPDEYEVPWLVRFTIRPG